MEPDVDFAVVIGIDRYDSELDRLKGPPNDAKLFIEWLNTTSAGPVRSDRIFKKLKEVTHADVVRLFSKLLDKVPQEGARRLYVFVSGHGFAESVRDSAVYTSEHSHHAEACFDMVKTADLIRFSGLFREVVVFVDCCRQMKRFPASGVPLKVPTVTEGAQHFYCFASLFGQAATEQTFGSTHHGIFSINVLRALQGMDSRAVDYRGQVTARTLARHLTERPGTNGCVADYIPRDDQSLERLILAKGFAPPDRSLQVELADPTKKFGLWLYRDRHWAPLDWPRVEQSPGVYKVEREDEFVVVITVPAEPPDRAAVQRSVLPQEKKVRILC